MKEIPVTVRIKTLQRRPEAAESFETHAEGALRQEGEAWVLTYGEGKELDGSHTTLRLEGDRVTMKRSGAVTSEMPFRVGETTACRYETAYGELPMAVTTLKLEWSMDRQGGSVFLLYKLRLGGAEVGENRLRLHCQCKGEAI